MEQAPQSTTGSANQNPLPISPGRFLPFPFLAAVLLFLAPFIDIRCNDVSLQRVSGIGLATGFEIKNNDNSLLGHMDAKDSDINISHSGKREGNIYAMIALCAGIAGGVLSLLKIRDRGWPGIIAGAIGAAALFALMMDIKSQLKLDLSTRSDALNIHFGIQFTPWFYLAIIAFLTGAGLSYKGMSNPIPRS